MSQSILFETNPLMWETLLQNVEKISPLIGKTSLEFIHSKFIRWSNQVNFNNFDEFEFHNAENFEPLSSYYELVTRPVGDLEVACSFEERRYFGSKYLAWTL